MYGNSDGSIPATFQILFWIGWKPDPTQPKALERGSADVSLKDIHRLDEIVETATKGFIPQENDDDARK